MNILPKKSWHVRTKANIERVRRDEEKAAAEEKEKQRRIAVAEQEARTDLLRNKAQKRKLESDGGSPQRATDKSPDQVELFGGNKHINFFSDLEKGEGQSKGNADYEREKKEEKEKYEKSIGLLTYLGQSAVESQTADTKPWYFKPPEREPKPGATSSSDDKSKHVDEFQRKKKSLMDPMRSMNDYLEKKQKHDDFKHNRDPYKKKHKHKHKHRDTKKGVKPSSGSKTVEQLRTERLQRERTERVRSEELLIRAAGGTVASNEPKVEMDERQRRYNSQFNPDLVRKPKPKHSYEHY